MYQGSVIVAIIIIVVAMVFIVTSGMGALLVGAWRLIAATMKACVQVPWGACLMILGIVIAWRLSGLIGCVLGAVLVYAGGNYLFAAIEGLDKASRPSKPDR